MERGWFEGVCGYARRDGVHIRAAADLIALSLRC
jgi:hypothetical protein